MRTANSLKNLKYNSIALIINLLTQFVSRTIFIWILGQEYLGLDGLFNNVLTILSLADMGIGTVLAYTLYDPLARKDYTTIQQWLNAYRKIYRIIAIIILALGICIIPLLPILTGSASNTPNLTWIYILYLLNAVASYAFIYKISLISADQKNYIISLNKQLFATISSLVMIIALFITKQFILYLIIQIIFTLISNFRIARIANAMYPFAKQLPKTRLSTSMRREIYHNTTATIMHKIGGVVVNGTDNILMSIMIGINTVGIYANYLLITHAIRKITEVYTTSVVASVGNLSTENDSDKLYETFFRVNYGNFILTSFCSTCLFCLLNAFIYLWLGNDYLFNTFIVAVIVIAFYVNNMRQPALCFIEAMGLYTKNKLAPVIEVLCNLILSVILTWQIGVAGIILGTALSQLMVCTFWEAFIIHKYSFKHKMSRFIVTYIKNFVVSIFITTVAFLATSYLPATVGAFAFKTLFSIILSTTLLILLTHQTPEFKYFLRILRSKLFSSKQHH